MSASITNLPEKEQKSILDKLQTSYATLVRLRHEKLSHSVTLRLQTLQKRLEDMFELLNCW